MALADMFNKGKDLAINTLLNSALVKGFVNSKLSRYAEVKSITRNDGHYSIVVQPLGSAEIIEIIIKDFDIDANELTLTPKGVSASMLWVNNLLQDFVEGKPISIPEKYREMIEKVKNLIGK